MATMRSEYNKVAGLNKALRSLPKETSKRLKAAAKGISQTVATDAESKARGVGRAYKLVSIKAGTDRVPVVRMTAPKDKPVTYGAEFGGRKRKTTMQFLPHLGQVGYALYPTVRERSQDIQDRYSAALGQALRDI